MFKVRSTPPARGLSIYNKPTIMKFSLKGYWEPTPKNIRKFADSLLAGAMTVSTFSFVNDYHTIAYAVLIIAGIAKFISNFFVDDQETLA